MVPNFVESNSIGFPPFLGLGANAPVMASRSATASSTNPLGTQRPSETKPRRSRSLIKSSVMIVCAINRFEEFNELIL